MTHLPADAAVGPTDDGGPDAPLIARALLIDLDGTLLDSTEAIVASWGRVADSVGVDRDVVASLMHGIPPRQVVDQIAPWLNREARAGLVEQFHVGVILDQSPVAWKAGAKQLVDALQGEQWAVVTSGSRDLAESSMRKAGMRPPPLLVTADDIEVGKPDPAPYLRAARLLDVPAEQCLVVEDAPAGITAGRRAQMRVVAVTGTYAAASLDEATVVVDRLPRVRVV
ncbi:MAG: HAD family hydrolase, partial [Janthinobacterium lividum]